MEEKIDLDNAKNEEKKYSILLEFLLLPWIVVWGWYAVLGLFLFIFNNRSNRFSVELEFFNFQSLEQSIPLAIIRLFIFSLILSLGSFVVSHFLKKDFPKSTNFFFVLNGLLLLFFTFLIFPIITSLLF